MLRHPAVAGQFYKGSSEALKNQVASFIDPAPMKRRAIAVLSPHAGLMYSGSVAGAVYSGIELPGTIVLIGPNHTGLGAPLSLMAEGEWETPLGTVNIDEAVARSILSRSRRVQQDTLAHLREHSLEVQLPFIQYLKPDCRIVPIQMLDTRLETCLELGRAVGEAVLECGMRNAECKPERQEAQAAARDVLIVASSDMTHYEDADTARSKDFLAIHEILNLDPEGLYRTVRNNGITMCGYGPAVAMLTAAKALGATKAELIKYTNSGEVSGDYKQVVAYAGVVVV